MRILHTSDWHLGQHFYGKSRAREHQQFLTWLIQQAISQQADAIIVAGDIFDTGNPPSYARELYFNFISELQQQTHKAERECRLVVLAGNHDSSAMIGESKQLMSAFASHVVPAVTDNISEQVFTLNANGNSAVMCAVPFIRPRDITKSTVGQSALDKQQNLQQAITTHYQTLFSHAQKCQDQVIENHDKNTLTNGCPIITTGHLTTVGASTSDSVREIYIGTLDAFPASQFPNADYIALGHIHQMQNVAKSAHIRYCGSPIPLSFDESKQQKQVLLVDVKANEEPMIQPLDVPCFQRLMMVKSSIETIVADVELAISDTVSDVANTPLWLDIEIESSNYRSDVQTSITEQLQPYVDNSQIEILLIRRSKQQREQWLTDQDKVTLDELSATDVFEERLKQATWSDNDVENENKKQRLTQLFKQALDELPQHTSQPEPAEALTLSKDD